MSISLAIGDDSEGQQSSVGAICIWASSQQANKLLDAIGCTNGFLHLSATRSEAWPAAL